MSINKESVFAGVAEAAGRVGISVHYLRQRIAAGTAPYIYSGRKILVNVPKLTEILMEESTKNLQKAE